jgi:hypothetical protein
MHLSPRSRALSKGKGQAAEEFVESRLRHLGFPTFGAEEIVGEEAEGTMTLEIGYPGLGEDSTESSAPLVADIVGLVGKEMSLGPGKVRLPRVVVVMVTVSSGDRVSELVERVASEQSGLVCEEREAHCGLAARQLVGPGAAFGARRHGHCAAQGRAGARVDQPRPPARAQVMSRSISFNSFLIHSPRNRLTGQLARLLLRGLVSHWTGEMLVCVFAHDGSRRIWRAPVQHSDKFGAVNIVPIPRSPRDAK